jgi:hypothetical protein
VLSHFFRLVSARKPLRHKKDITVGPMSVNPWKCTNYVWGLHFHSSSGVEYFHPLLDLPPILFLSSLHLTVYCCRTKRDSLIDTEEGILTCRTKLFRSTIWQLEQHWHFLTGEGWGRLPKLRKRMQYYGPYGGLKVRWSYNTHA